MSDKTRTPKDPAVKAQEAVEVLTRRLTKIRAAKDVLEGKVRELVTEERAVSKRLEYARANPDLPRTEAKPDKE